MSEKPKNHGEHTPDEEFTLSTQLPELTPEQQRIMAGIPEAQAGTNPEGGVNVGEVSETSEAESTIEKKLGYGSSMQEVWDAVNSFYDIEYHVDSNDEKVPMPNTQDWNKLHPRKVNVSIKTGDDDHRGELRKLLNDGLAQEQEDRERGADFSSNFTSKMDTIESFKERLLFTKYSPNAFRSEEDRQKSIEYCRRDFDRITEKVEKLEQTMSDYDQLDAVQARIEKNIHELNDMSRLEQIKESPAIRGLLRKVGLLSEQSTTEKQSADRNAKIDLQDKLGDTQQSHRAYLKGELDAYKFILSLGDFDTIYSSL
ncbi:hypothetical protein FWF48_01225 [Candidatus Saccharibacteria bacterium]|nr:hypothetical protein [Candidatus Saccharibacteria bacterium]